MKPQQGQTRRRIAIFLLIFMIVVAVILWLVSPTTEQSVFGFLLAAELTAFSMLLYVYRNEASKQLSKVWLGIGFLGLAALVLLSIATTLQVLRPPPKPNVNIALFEGEISATTSGFGLSADNLTSPGPTLTFKVGDVVNVTVTDVGQEPHNWAIVSANQSNAPVLFNAQVRTVNDPLEHGESAWTIFTVSKAGNFYYICQIPGHLEVDGMWGSVVVNQ